MDYNFQEIEKKWQEYWAKNSSFKAEESSEKPKYYVLDMFPYPSGAGLHVGHPLGYIASDIVSRYKRHKGFNVLHPMGYDSFGLPAEQYAIQTGQHPAITTEENIKRYRQQLDQIGFSFDWSREVRTSDPNFYKWTQWIFLQLFNSWYDAAADSAKSIETLVQQFESKGSEGINAVTSNEEGFTAEAWNALSDIQKEEILQKYRLAYRAESTVNWCPALGTVLANDEVKDGLSERGGHPVVQKKMMQWSLRITAYAQRLLDGLNEIDWSESLKESQRNWIGRSEGASVHFALKDREEKIEVFTTRPDTIFGVSFMVLAPENPLVDEITTEAYRSSVDKYKVQAAKKSERDRLADVKTVSGQFTGAYAVHPFSGKELPIWIGDYVLASYGTGAVMSVPAHDSRDYAFAKYFDLPILPVVEGGDVSKESYDAKEGKVINSDFLNGLDVKEAVAKAIAKIEEEGLGKGKVNFRLRDAIFGRQRYWGEPIPVYYKDGVPHSVKQEHLPLELPQVDAYLPTEDGEPPLARGQNWNYDPEKGVVANGEGYPLEQTTMPGWAGSSWYDLRYMDPFNTDAPVSEKADDYWQNVDLYIGGSEHATGHLLYTRFWHKFLKDQGIISQNEPFKKLINQGMILGTSAFAYRVEGQNKFVSRGLRKDYKTVPVHVDVNTVNASDEMDVDAFKLWRDDLAGAEFVSENGKFLVGREVEKMSKSKYNVVNPDDIIEQYGADTLRMYEMFLGPLEQSKPWNTAGITGVHGFLKKLTRLYKNEADWNISDEKADDKELKALHVLIKKVNEDIEAFSFNTSVSAFMICVNELGALKCNKLEILEPLAVLISPFAPHLAEELWTGLGHEGGISVVPFPIHNEDYLTENSFEYPVAFNGKMRFKEELSLEMAKDAVEKHIMGLEKTATYLDGKSPKKVIVVPGKIVNIVM
ncbi:leucyl-tRNA synthetase [Owenweeksia hongkongensis DSM 17368]|uniref:Leucine--tRNA ligase n=1 Tax=Owenweeksia hongkongensis (strain DSM 17368 / CIP 108786 / JCM 12287 / NRRL B-23963 / UST20020801) TaxID=926562 RepID=G8R041_OWEHD|nr:leucine--tRNA ligase [Owenweeksia hongkongensis]AEV33707.1 leucyl-tRNA synthetase [Owenweeksia hongkongensis DSM 17368]